MKFMISLTKANDINDKTVRILNTAFHNDDLTKISLPINLEYILEKYKINIEFVHFQDPTISGAFDKETRTIYVSEDDPYPDNAFIIAHEFGHLMLHENQRELFSRKSLINITDEERDEDKESNLFAANLLMPEELVNKYWKQTHNVLELSNIFGISVAAVSFRLKTLELQE